MGMLVLSPEDMQEAKKSIREKGIKADDAKKLPPIEKLCEPTTHPPTVEVHSLLDFNASDIPKGKPPDQCLDELDNFIMKQNHFNEKVQGQLHDNTLAIKNLLDVLGRTVNDVKCLVKHFHMVQTQLQQISNVQKYLLANNAKHDNLQAFGIKTRGGTHIQDLLYPEGHPKRIEQDSQVQEEEIVSSPKKKKKKKKHKEAGNSNDPIEEEEHVVDPNSISTSDAETEDGAEQEKMLKRMVHPRFEKKKHPTSVRSILEKISSQEDTRRNENHGYKNPCPSQASPSKPKKKSTTTSFVSG